MKNATLMGMLDAGNSHVRLDEGEVASVTPKRGFPLFYSATVVRAFRSLALAVGVVGLAGGAFASQTSPWAVFKNAVSSDWMDVGNWCNEDGSATGVLPLTGSHNVNIPVGTTCSLTNEQSGYYNFQVAGTAGASGKKGLACFEIGSGGMVGSTVSAIGVSAGTTGIVYVASNGYSKACAPVIGSSGVGIVTNAGKWYAEGVMKLGVNSGSFGRLVYESGATTETGNSYRPIYIGIQGQGELVVAENANFWWPIYNMNGAVQLGCGPQDNRILVESNGVFRFTRLYIGGRKATVDDYTPPAGRGEVRLRGGSLAYDIEAPNEWTIWLGAYESDGAIDPNSYGAIRGWGKVTGWGDRKGDYSAHYLIGYGEICADGEGDESRVLDCTIGMTGISNALPASVATESGWRAVNKGIVYPRGSAQLGTTDLGLERTACVGCTSSLEKPCFVNSVRVTARGLTQMTNQRYFGSAICALDRTDAHTNALPACVSVLGVIKVGVFDNRSARAYSNRSGVASAEVMVRYDQTKILRNDTRLEMWRYVEKDGKWSRVARLGQGARPSDCCMTSCTVNGNLAETFNLGTFAVIEREVFGMSVIFK